MKIHKINHWVYYVGDTKELIHSKCGKWMYFFDNQKIAEQMCNKAVINDIVCESKHSDAPNGVACFYLNGDDMIRHKKILQFFIENHLIKRTLNGRLHNISFKFDSQTRAGQYGSEFSSDIKLSQFINLDTGKFLEI